MSSWPRRNQHFADDNIKCIFLNENIWISIKISLIYVQNIPIHIKTNVGSENGLMPNRRQAIIWTRDGLYSLSTHIYASLGPNDLMGIGLCPKAYVQKWLAEKLMI